MDPFNCHISMSWFWTSKLHSNAIATILCTFVTQTTPTCQWAFHSHTSQPMIAHRDQGKSFTARIRRPYVWGDCFLRPSMQKRREIPPSPPPSMSTDADPIPRTLPEVSSQSQSLCPLQYCTFKSFNSLNSVGIYKHHTEGGVGCGGGGGGGGAFLLQGTIYSVTALAPQCPTLYTRYIRTQTEEFGNKTARIV